MKKATVNAEDILDRPWKELMRSALPDDFVDWDQFRGGFHNSVNTRLYNVVGLLMVQRKLETVRDLCRLSKRDFVRRKNFGSKCMNRLRELLSEYGLDVGCLERRNRQPEDQASYLEQLG